jgi:hypothetical protein
MSSSGQEVLQSHEVDETREERHSGTATGTTMTATTTTTPPTTTTTATTTATAVTTSATIIITTTATTGTTMTTMTTATTATSARSKGASTHVCQPSPSTNTPAIPALARADINHIDDEQPEAGPHRRRHRCYYLTPLGERVVDLVRTRLATPGERLRWDGVRTILARVGRAAQ